MDTIATWTGGPLESSSTSYSLGRRLSRMSRTFRRAPSARSRRAFALGLLMGAKRAPRSRARLARLLMRRERKRAMNKPRLDLREKYDARGASLLFHCFLDAFSMLFGRSTCRFGRSGERTRARVPAASMRLPCSNPSFPTTRYVLNFVLSLPRPSVLSS